MADADTTTIGRVLKQSRELPALLSTLKAEVLAARGAVDVHAAIQAVASASPTANLVRNAAHAVAQGLPGELSAAPQIVQPCGCHPDASEGAEASDAPAAAALAAARACWARLIAARLDAAQALLPEYPLAAAPLDEEQLQELRRAAAHLPEAWERIGSPSSPFTGELQELGPSIFKLLYDSSDLLEAICTPPEAGDADAEQPGVGTAAPGIAAAGEAGSRAAAGSGGATAPDAKAARQHERRRRRRRARPSGGDDGSGGSSSSSSSSEEGEGGARAAGGGTRGGRCGRVLAHGAAGCRSKRWRRWLSYCAGPNGALLWAVRAPTLAWLQSFFADLRPDRRQVGLDDVMHPWFREQQVAHARLIISSASAAACRAAARTGLPPSARPAAWACALGLPPRPGVGNTATPAQPQPGPGPESYQPSRRDEDVLAALCEGVERQRLLADALTVADACCVADSRHYFPFADAVRAVVLAFSRDSAICRSARAPPLPRLASEGRGGRLRVYPPSGVLPFRGLAALAAPLAFVYRSPASMYRAFAALYCRHWSGLHGLAGGGAPAPGMAALCRTFVELLEELDPAVARHMESIGLPPLEAAFPWMFAAFSGYLSPAETLLLWDRVVGFDSLLPLPLLAVAVLRFRRALILSAASADELVEAMEDLGVMRVAPLLQALLFGG